MHMFFEFVENSFILSKTCFFGLEMRNPFFLLCRVASKMTKKFIQMTLTILVKKWEMKVMHEKMTQKQAANCYQENAVFSRVVWKATLGIK